MKSACYEVYSTATSSFVIRHSPTIHLLHNQKNKKLRSATADVYEAPPFRKNFVKLLALQQQTSCQHDALIIALA